MSKVQALLLGAALLSATCGERAGSPCDTAGSGPPDAVDAASMQAQAAASPSCLAAGPGLSDCGSAKESCCTSLPVAGGTFYRTYSNGGCSASAEADPATVSSFRLDKYDVTVGRFRQFVNAWNGSWRPAAGSGKHTHLNGGSGLTDSGPSGGYEPGWSATDNTLVSPTGANLTSCAGSNLTTDLQLVYYSCNTWTDTPGTQENRPIVCVNWYEAYAFCIWDGGFLPSEAEWEYATAGGSEQREYPWGSAEPGSANQYAIYNCNYPTSAVVCSGAFEIAPVGFASLGAGRWGQLDLVGNVWQWNLDGYAPYMASVDGYLDVQYSRAIRGGSFETYGLFFLNPWWYADEVASHRHHGTGLRCARTP